MDELDELAALHADERVWLHRPDGRHVSVEYSRAKVAEMEQQWSRDGLGYWVARLGQPIAGVSADTFVGVGGCAVEASGDWWNLYYRLRPELHGHGFATEICHAALAAAHSVCAERPVLANLLEENRASKATAERAGLQLQWRGHGRGSPEAVRLIYADRPLDADQLAAVVSHI
jgi:RimJ/RimL family protein N-acetyltransferase